jgi:hypothetical protein
LKEDLGRSAKVDGHDCGAGETNIFIFTSGSYLLEPSRDVAARGAVALGYCSFPRGQWRALYGDLATRFADDVHNCMSIKRPQIRLIERRRLPPGTAIVIGAFPRSPLRDLARQARRPSLNLEVTLL